MLGTTALCSQLPRFHFLCSSFPMNHLQTVRRAGRRTMFLEGKPAALLTALGLHELSLPAPASPAPPTPVLSFSTFFPGAAPLPELFISSAFPHVPSAVLSFPSTSCTQLSYFPFPLCFSVLLLPSPVSPGSAASQAPSLEGQPDIIKYNNLIICQGVRWAEAIVYLLYEPFLWPLGVVVNFPPPGAPLAVSKGLSPCQPVQAVGPPRPVGIHTLGTVPGTVESSFTIEG